MKKSKFSESQIVNILKEAEVGISLEDLSRQHGFSKASFYKWKGKYSGMSVSELKRLKALEEENRRLRHDRKITFRIGSMLAEQVGHDQVYRRSASHANNKEETNPSMPMLCL